MINKRLISTGGAAEIIATDNFAPVLYTGNGSTQSISSLDFQPDLVWIKGRSFGWPHRLQDSARGATKYLNSATTDAETTSANTVTSFDTNGFTLGADGNVNAGYGNTYVSWCWKGGGTAVSNTDGTITSQVSANQAAGFSIVKFNTQSSGSGTFGHGLSSAPQLIITKLLDSASGWNTYNETIGNNQFLHLDTAAAATGAVNRWNSTSPTSTVFTLGGDFAGGNPGIAYCFHSVDGYQKVGTYTGSGSSLNTISVGFAPRFVLFKRTDSTGGWRIFDSTRGTDKSITVNSSGAEYDDTQNYVDFTSDGFEFNRTVTQGNPDINASGGTYIYLAIA